MFNLNTQLVNELPEGLALAQRGFYYADFLFETIRVFEGKIPLIQAHWERLSGGLKMMRYQIPPAWSAAFFEKEIQKITPPNARVRLSVWIAVLTLMMVYAPNTIKLAYPEEQQRLSRVELLNPAALNVTE